MFFSTVGLVCTVVGSATAGAIFHAAVSKWWAKRGVTLPNR